MGLDLPGSTEMKFIQDSKDPKSTLKVGFSSEEMASNVAIHRHQDRFAFGSEEMAPSTGGSESPSYLGISDDRSHSALSHGSANSFSESAKSNDAEEKDDEEDKEKHPKKLGEESKDVKGSDGALSTGGSMFSTASQNLLSTARILEEPLAYKISEAKWVFVSIFVNLALLIFFILLGWEISVPIPVDFLQGTGTLIIQALLLAPNMICIRALDEAFSAFYGHKLCTSRGYSMAVCGFHQTSAIHKLSFCNQLSLSSKCRKDLNKLAYIWFFLEMLKISMPVVALAFSKSVGSTVGGVVNCVEFGQFNEPVDRKWPILNSTSGIGELVFGNALGLMRSQMDVPKTTFVMTPQIIGAVQDGDSLDGSGFVTDIFTECRCTTMKPEEIVRKSPTMTLTTAQKLIDNSRTISKLGIANQIVPLEESVIITTLFTNTKVCGGRNNTSQFAPVCKTIFDNHRNAEVISYYMTDGTPASIAQELVQIKKVNDKANITWVYKSLQNILESDSSIFTLPATIPGIVNPILFWTTSNLLIIDPAYLDAGVETMFSMLLRAGMQRTFSVLGKSCTKVLKEKSITNLKLDMYGVGVAAFILGTQLLFSILALLAYLPWLARSDCIGPAVRAVKDKAYFAVLVTGSPIGTGTNEMQNSPTYQLWQGYDTFVRIGEHVQTLSQEVGHIVLDKPKLVKKMAQGRKFL